MHLYRYKSQLVFPYDKNIPHIYELISGTVTILSATYKVIKQVSAPYVLNLVETIYQIPTLKNVRAEVKCQIKKVLVNDKHKQIIRQWKDQGLRKSRFRIFEEVHSAHFYELIRYGNMVHVRKQEWIKAKENHMYLVVSGGLVVSGSEKTLKIIKLQQGEVLLSTDANQILHSSTGLLQLMEISIPIARTLLGSSYDRLDTFLNCQKSALSSLQSRNQSLSCKLRRNRDKMMTGMNVPMEFVNKINEKVKNFEKYCRAKSCLSYMAPKSKADILQQNQVRFRELLDLDRRKYGRQYIYNKRIQLSQKVCSSVISPQQSSRNSSTQKSQHSKHIYLNSSMKQEYGIMLTNPTVQRWRQTHKIKGLLKKVGREGKEKENFNQFKFLKIN